MPLTLARGSQQRLDQIMNSLDALAMLPQVTLRITQCVNDPASTAADLEHIISHDPALASRLLKLVNSAFYARASSIASVGRAIVLLGFDAVQHLALAAAMGQLFKATHICEGYGGKDLWTHCIAVAAVSRELARRTGAVQPDEVFLCGLLHDIGLLASLQVCRGQLRQVCERAKIAHAPFVDLELEMIGVDHPQLGAALAERWRLPASGKAAAAWHHAPSDAEGRHRTIAGLVHVADVLCCQHPVGLPLTALRQTICGEVVAELVPPALLEQASAELDAWTRPALTVLG